MKPSYESTDNSVAGHCSAIIIIISAASEHCYLSTLFNVLKQQNGGLEIRVGQPQQEVSQCLSAPASLQPFFKDQESAPSGKHTLSPSTQVVSNLQMTRIIFQGDLYHPVTLFPLSVLESEWKPFRISFSVSVTLFLLSSRRCVLVWMYCLVPCLQLPLRLLPHRPITKYDRLHV